MAFACLMCVIMCWLFVSQQPINAILYNIAEDRRLAGELLYLYEQVRESGNDSWYEPLTEVLASQAQMRYRFIGPKPRVLFCQWQTPNDAHTLVQADFVGFHGPFLAFSNLARRLKNKSHPPRYSMTGVEGINKFYLGQVLEWGADILIGRYIIPSTHDWARSIASYDVVVFWSGGYSNGFVPPASMFPAVANQTRLVALTEPNNFSQKPWFPAHSKDVFPTYSIKQMVSDYPDICPGFIDNHLPPKRDFLPAACGGIVAPLLLRVPIKLYRRGLDWNSTRTNLRTAFGDGISSNSVNAIWSDTSVTNLLRDALKKQRFLAPLSLGATYETFLTQMAQMQYVVLGSQRQYSAGQVALDAAISGALLVGHVERLNVRLIAPVAVRFGISADRNWHKTEAPAAILMVEHLFANQSLTRDLREEQQIRFNNLLAVGTGPSLRQFGFMLEHLTNDKRCRVSVDPGRERYSFPGKGSSAYASFK